MITKPFLLFRRLPYLFRWHTAAFVLLLFHAQLGRRSRATSSSLRPNAVKVLRTEFKRGTKAQIEIQTESGKLWKKVLGPYVKGNKETGEMADSC